MLFAFIVFTSAFPMLFGGYTSAFPILKVVKQLLDYTIILLCFGGFFLLRHNRFSWAFFLIPFTYWLIYFFNRYNGVQPPFDFLNILELVLLGFLYPTELIFLLKVYRKALVFTSMAGIIAYVSFFAIPAMPHTISVYYLDEMGRSQGNLYYDYYYAIVFVGKQGIRLCGLCDEPGRFGTMLALMLIIEKLNFRRWGNIVILIACVLTLSLAAIVIIVLYAIVMSVRSPKVGVVLGVIVLVLIYVIPELASNNEGFDKIAERLQFVDGKMSGDNRTGDDVLRLMKMQMSSISTALWGYGTGSLLPMGFTTLVFLNYVFSYGVVGATIMFIPPLLLALKYTRMNYAALVYWACFILSLYQRPHLYTIQFFILLYGGILYTVYEKAKSVNSYSNTEMSPIKHKNKHNENIRNYTPTKFWWG